MSDELLYENHTWSPRGDGVNERVSLDRDEVGGEYRLEVMNSWGDLEYVTRASLEVSDLYELHAVLDAELRKIEDERE